MAPRSFQFQPLNTGASYASNLNYDRQSLTPRTPRSRLGIAEEGEGDAIYSNIELTVVQDDEDSTLNREDEQNDSVSMPLLANIRAKVSGMTSSSEDKSGVGTKSSLKSVLMATPPMLGILAAVFLSFLIIISWKWPNTLSEYLGNTNTAVPQEDDSVIISSPDSSSNNISPQLNNTNVLSYADYDNFPLTPIQYLHECNLYQASIKHPIGDYWYTPPDGPLDVIHHDVIENVNLPEHDPTIRTCTSSITYMLDGYVGLAADLALMAQVAGLAREVCKYDVF